MKLEEKRFIESAILSNTASLILRNNFSEDKDYTSLVKISVEIAQEQLKQRNELFGAKEKVIKLKNEVPNIDFEEIINIFNSVCVELPTATKCTIEREKAIIKILETHTLEDIGSVFKNTSESEYLCGRKVEWKADIDWILTPKNFIKILENKYKNIENGNKEQSNSELFKSAVNSDTAKNFRFV